MGSPRWDPSPEPVPEKVRAAFWRDARVEEIGGRTHWRWTGCFQPRPTLLIDGKYVSASRVAYALAHPGEKIPLRLTRRPECTIDDCVAASCFTGLLGTVGRGGFPASRDTDVVGASNAPTGNEVAGISVPPLIAAMAHLQFGTEVTPVHRRFHTSPGLPAEACGAPTEKSTREDRVALRAELPPRLSVEEIRPPATPRRAAAGWRGNADLSAETVLEALLVPETSIVVFEGGGVWIFGAGGARINEADPVTAVRRLLRLRGQLVPSA